MTKRCLVGERIVAATGAGTPAAWCVSNILLHNVYRDKVRAVPSTPNSMPSSTAARRLLPALLLAAAMPAAAQIQVPSGSSVVLATYFEIDPESCRPLASPRVRITGNGVLGKAIVVRTQGKVSATTRCPHKLVPISQVLYQADKPGIDAISWDVRYLRRNARVERVSSQVNVTPRAR